MFLMDYLETAKLFRQSFATMCSAIQIFQTWYGVLRTFSVLTGVVLTTATA